jgi:metal-sulfur cluster biosynthetic enzyme
MLIEILKTIIDPELNCNIWDLGLIYSAQIQEDKVEIVMTFTSPTCPEAQNILDNIALKISEKIPNLPLKVSITWDPKWSPSMMSEDLQFEMGV